MTAVLISPLDSKVTWEEYSQHPQEGTEWVDGHILEKSYMTIKHGTVQLNLSYLLRSYQQQNNLRGRFVLETVCRTMGRGRRPDIGYMSAEQVAKYANATVVGECFDWIGEIVSPDDSAEDLFTKSREYLDAGCREVWLVFPENKMIIINYRNQQGQLGWQIYYDQLVITSLIAFPELQISADELFAGV